MSSVLSAMSALNKCPLHLMWAVGFDLKPKHSPTMLRREDFTKYPMEVTESDLGKSENACHRGLPEGFLSMKPGEITI